MPEHECPPLPPEPKFRRMGHSTCEEDRRILWDLCKQAHKYLCFPDLGAAVEVGCWSGGTTLVLAAQFDKVYCVDTWGGTASDRTGQLAMAIGNENLFRVFCENMAEHLFSCVTPCVGTSLMWSRILSGRRADPASDDGFAMVFLDADHDYHSAYADIMSWKPLVRPRGILCGHDYNSFAGVNRAVDELIPDAKVMGDIWWTQIPPDTED